MATLQQTVTAQRFSGAVRNMVEALKSTGANIPKIVNFWNGLTDPAKNALCALENLDRAEMDSVIATLSTLNISLDALPSVTSTF